MPSNLVKHLDRLERSNNEAPLEGEDDTQEFTSVNLKPSEILTHWVDNKSFKHKGLDDLRNGRVGMAFHELDMIYQHGEPFDRAITCGRDIRKLIEDLQEKGH